MLDLLLRRYPYFDNDGSPGGTPDDGAEGKPEEKDQPDKPEAGDDKPTDPAVEKKFSQAELDAILKERLEREKKKHEAAAEKARKEAEEAALAKNQEWQTLAEKRAEEIAALTKERDELAAVKELAEKYEAALKSQLAKSKEKLPDYLQEVIDRMDPLEAMEYITRNADKIGVKAASYSETPEPREKKVSDEDKQAGKKALSTVVHRTF